MDPQDKKAYSENSCIAAEEVKPEIGNFSDEEPLINGNKEFHKQDDGEEYRVYWYRWYILFQFAMLSLIQTANAGMWSPISLSAMKALGFTSHDFDLLANWGVSGLLVFLPVDMWLIIKFGMRPAVFAGAICVFLGSGIRCLPLGMNRKYAIHVGQMLNGIGGCPVMGAAPYISNVWFPLKDRVLATGIMILSGNVGGIMSSLLGPYLVQQPQNTTGMNVTDNAEEIRHEISTYLYINFGLATFVFVMMLTFFPNKPPTPPSRTAGTDRLDFVAGVKALLKNRAYWAIVAISCASVGSFYGWMGIMAVLYEKRGISQKTIGLMVTSISALGVFVGIVFSWLADRVKTYQPIMWISSILLAYTACLYLVAISMKWIPVEPFIFSITSLWISCSILGVMIYGIQPLAMEMASDAAYPISEGIAVYILSWLLMLVNVIFFTSLSAIKNQDVAFYLMLGMMSTAPPLLYFSIQKANTRLQVDIQQ